MVQEFLLMLVYQTLGHLLQVMDKPNANISSMYRLISSGLYFKLRKYNLPYPEAVFEGGYFRQNPLPFYGLIRELFPSTLTPTTTHKFFSLLHQKGILRRIYTQNIDALEHLAGVPEVNNKNNNYFLVSQKLG